MPSKSAKQHRLMEAVAHSPAFAKKVGIPQSVGKDFAEADKGKKFGVGGSIYNTQGGKGQINKQGMRAGSIFGYKKEVPDVMIKRKDIGLAAGGETRADRAVINKRKTDHGQEALFNKGGKIMKKIDDGKAFNSAAKIRKTDMVSMPGPKMKKGGPVQDAAIEAGEKALKFGEHADQKKGHTRGKNLGDSGKSVKDQTGATKMAKGGKIDGIAMRGKTKGKYC